MASVKLGTKSVGDVVKLNVNGTATNFIVVHQGLPSSVYDSSCNGTWLLMQDIYVKKAWDSDNNNYANSDVHSYLNSTFLGLLDSNIQEAIETVKIPYTNGTGSGGSLKTGSNGLSTKIFLLSGDEVGAGNESNLNAEGAKLDYFDSTTSSSSKRVAYYNGSAADWWLRSPNTNNTYYAWYVNTDGGTDSRGVTYSYGVRPALILDSLLSVSDDGVISTNEAPTAPASITIPESIMGGTSITVSWGEATDADDNLAGYKVEKSTDGGSTWSQIYQGTVTSTTNTVAFGTESVMYRVKAYDDDGEESAYKTSAQVTVVNNNAPTAPASISVPNEVNGGGTMVISWAASTDEDDNLSGYILERSDDGGDYAEIYKGTALMYTDTVTKGLSTVQYRVCAYDEYVQSAYTTSASRTVNNNIAPVITCSYADGTDLGEKTSGFTVTYSVDDEDESDDLTVTETLDGVTKRTFTATRAATNSFAVTGDYFQQVLNGTHTMVISATDGNATVKHTLTFTKSVTSASITLTEPLTVDGSITLAVIHVLGSIPSDAVYTVQVTNNANDDSPVWQDCTSECKSGANIVFENTVAENGAAFNFKVNVAEGSSGTSGYITAVTGAFE